ncbi:MFS transporter [Nocardia aurantiaca]|uniref:MFS transporter n=1 Tax=Nocardia aurantiaca TaxID=2675850 RepID=A0A6I3KRQ9_9NOCA|nr:MFS transporter [Nocardia aurantiaca]MTE12602.1 MFS transporter [Nocardia aurantiaca]
MTPAPPEANRATLRYLTLGLLCSVQMMLNLDDTIVNVALPTIQRHLHMSETDLTWIINAYLLLFGGFLLVGGRSADLFGGKHVFLIGVTVFGLSSLATGLAQNSAILIASRAGQGIGGAFASPAALSIVATLFTDPRERSRALGIWAGLGGLAATLGVVLSGVMTEYAGWRWCFLINVPVAVLALVLAHRLLPDRRAARTGIRLDGLSAALITSAIAALDLGLIDSGHSSGLATAARIALGLTLLAAFLLRAGRSRVPMIPLSFFRDRDRAVANTANILFCSAILSMLFFLTLHLQQVLHFTPLRTGLAWLPFCALVIAGFATAAALVPNLGVRPILVAAMASGAVGMLLLSRVPATAHYPALLPGMLTAGFGMGLGFVSITIAAVGETHADITGLASGFVTTTQQLGGALGLGVLSTIALHHRSTQLAAGASPEQALTQGFQLTYLISAVILTLTALLTAVGITATTGATRPDPLPVS